jgi:hypothetical protein
MLNTSKNISNSMGKEMVKEIDQKHQLNKI